MARPGLGIDIPANGGDRSDVGQDSQNFRIADVSSVKDVAAAAKGVERLWAEQAVRIRDDADEHRFDCRFWPYPDSTQFRCSGLTGAVMRAVYTANTNARSWRRFVGDSAAVLGIPRIPPQAGKRDSQPARRTRYLRRDAH